MKARVPRESYSPPVSREQVLQVVPREQRRRLWYGEVSLLVSNVSEESAASAIRKRQISFGTENFKTLLTVNDLSALRQQPDILLRGMRGVTRRLTSLSQPCDHLLQTRTTVEHGGIITKGRTPCNHVKMSKVVLFGSHHTLVRLFSLQRKWPHNEVALRSCGDIWTPLQQCETAAGILASYPNWTLGTESGYPRSRYVVVFS
jgi:hypothetical protein